MSRGDFWTRREVLRSGLLAALTWANRPAAAARETASWGFVLKETAGLRRFSYPVSTLLPGVAPGGGFRLLREGRVVPAQFRPVAGSDARPAIALDFTSSVFVPMPVQIGAATSPQAMLAPLEIAWERPGS